TSAAGANVPLDGSGSSDPNGDALTYTWSGPFGTATGIKPTVVMPLGINMVALVVDDGHGNTAQATVQITVMDTTLPVLTLPVSFTAMGNCSVVGSTVSLDAVGNCTVTGRQSGDATYSAATDVPQSFAIGQATSSTVVTCPATPQTYTGATQTPCTATYTTS